MFHEHVVLSCLSARPPHDASTSYASCVIPYTRRTTHAAHLLRTAFRTARQRAWYHTATNASRLGVGLAWPRPSWECELEAEGEGRCALGIVLSVWVIGK